MEGTKNWWESKTILYVLVGILFNGYNTLSGASGGQLPALPDWAALAINALLGGGAIQGRISATSSIGKGK